MRISSPLLSTTCLGKTMLHQNILHHYNQLESVLEGIPRRHYFKRGQVCIPVYTIFRRTRLRFYSVEKKLDLFMKFGNILPKMTLSDTEENKHAKADNNMDIGGALRDTLLEAKKQGRLTTGVYESSKMLEMNPDGVMLCVLPEIAVDDVTLRIHYTLIEAYCWENDIRLIKVDNCDKLSKLLTEPSRPLSNDNEVQNCLLPPKASTDFNCILLEYPSTQCSEAEEDVMQFCKITSDLSPSPVVNLDV